MIRPFEWNNPGDEWSSALSTTAILRVFVSETTIKKKRQQQQQTLPVKKITLKWFEYFSIKIRLK